MILEELLVKVGVNVDTAQLEKLDASLKNIPKIAIGIGAAMAGAVAGMSAFMSANLEALDAVYQLSNETGAAANEIYLLGKVAEVNGSSVEAAQATYKGLSRTIGEAANGLGRGAKAFEAFGLTAKNADGSVKTTSQVLEEVRQKMQGLSEQQQIAMLDKLGIDNSLIQTLRLTNEEFAQAITNAEAFSLGVGNPENAETAAAFQDSLTEIAQISKGMSEYFSLKLAPSLSNIIHQFRDWFLANQKLVKEGLTTAANILTKLVSFITGMAKAVDNVISHTIGWKNALYVLGGIILWVNRALLANPIFLLGAAIAGIILLLDDFIVYLNGGQSAFGEYWAKVLEIFNYWKANWGELAAITMAFFAILWSNGIRGIGLFTKLSSTFGGVVKVFGGLKSGIFSLGSAFVWLGKAIAVAFRTNPVGILVTLIIGAVYLIYKHWEPIKKFFSDLWGDITDSWNEFTSNFSLEDIEQAFAQVKDFIVKPFEEAFAWVKKQYDAYIKPIIDAVSSISIDGIEQKAKEIGNSISDKVSSAWNGAVSSVKGTYNDAVDSVKGFFGFGKENNPSTVAQVPAAGAMNTTNNTSIDNRKDITTHNSFTVNVSGTGSSLSDINAATKKLVNAINNTQSQIAY